MGGGAFNRGAPGGRLGTMAQGRNAMPSSMGRQATAMAVPEPGQARPMTAIRGAGFTSAGNRGTLNLSEGKVFGDLVL